MNGSSSRSHHKRSGAVDNELSAHLRNSSLSSVEASSPIRANGHSSGSRELFPTVSVSAHQKPDLINGFNIKGSAGLSIKGRGAARDTKELFPRLYSNNSNEGKELFSEKIRSGPRRGRADAAW